MIHFASHSYFLLLSFFFLFSPFIVACPGLRPEATAARVIARVRSPGSGYEESMKRTTYLKFQNFAFLWLGLGLGLGLGVGLEFD